MSTASVPIRVRSAPSFPRLRRHPLPIGIAAGLLLALALGPTISAGLAGLWAKLPTLKVVASPTGTLAAPREWRFEPRIVTFDSMIRERRPAPSPWIRGQVERERAKRSH